MEVDNEDYPVAEAEEKKPPIPPLNADEQASAARLSSDVPGAMNTGEAVEKNSRNDKICMFKDMHRLASDPTIPYVNWGDNEDVVFEIEPFEAYMKKHQNDFHYSPNWAAFHKLLRTRNMKQVSKTTAKSNKIITATYSHKLFKPGTTDELDMIKLKEPMQVHQAEYAVAGVEDKPPSPLTAEELAFVADLEASLPMEVDQSEESVVGAAN